MAFPQQADEFREDLRADAGQASASTSIQAAIEHAEATGDDLNVIPETFRPAFKAASGQNVACSVPARVPVQPSMAFDNRSRSSVCFPTEADFNHHLSRSFTVPQGAAAAISTRDSALDSIVSLSSAGQSTRMSRSAETLHVPSKDRR